MSRDYRLYLDDILESCKKIRAYTEGMSFHEFEADQRTQDAVIRNFEIIGEAAKRLPDEVKYQIQQIEWEKVIAFHNVPIHAYFGVSLETVWSVIQDKLPDLESLTRDFLSDKI